MKTPSPAPAIKPPSLSGVAGVTIEKQSSTGCVFHIEGGCRFVPYAWLMHVEGNDDTLLFEFTHCKATVDGVGLSQLFRSFTGWNITDIEVKASDKDRPHITSVSVEDKDPIQEGEE